MMSVSGCKNWKDPSIRYDQENNIEEIFLKKMRASGSCNFHLESCGVESICCGIEGVDGIFTDYLPTAAGIHYAGRGDMLFYFLNSYKIEQLLPEPSEIMPNNEIPENLAYSVAKISDCKGELHVYRNSKFIYDHMESMLRDGSALVMSYLTDYDTGHYITIVAYDEAAREFICFDPWKGNKHCINDGVHERYDELFFSDRARPRIIEVRKK